MDIEKDTIKAVLSFNGTEKPSAVYLATHAQKGLLAFGIYGNDVCDADDTEILADVREKFLRFGRAAVSAERLFCSTALTEKYGLRFTLRQAHIPLPPVLRVLSA